MEAVVPVFSSLDEIHFTPDVIVMCHAAVASGSHSIANDTLLAVNVDWTAKILDMFPLSKCIYISSVSVYGEPMETITEYSSVNPLSDYAKSKYIGEQIVMRNPRNSVIRFSSLYGAGMKAHTLLPIYCNQALRNKKIEVWGNGSRFQNYIHVSDAVALISKVVVFEDAIPFPVLGVFAKEYSNLQVAKVLAEATDSEIVFINADASKSFFYDNKISQKVLNWQPKMTIEVGLKKYLEWKEKQS